MGWEDNKTIEFVRKVAQPNVAQIMEIEGSNHLSGTVEIAKRSSYRVSEYNLWEAMRQ